MRRSSRLWGRIGGWLAAAAGLILLWVFLAIADELFWEAEREGGHGIDLAILRLAQGARAPELTEAAVDLTALGSGYVLAVVTVIAGTVLLLRRDGRGLVVITVAAVGAGILSTLFKDLFDRPRPEIVEALARATGDAYPSGHALGASAVYIALGLILASALPGPWGRAIVLALMALVVAAVGASRVYLGVHWPTDVAGGLALGAGWTLLVAAAAGLRRGPAAPVPFSPGPVVDSGPRSR